MEPLSWQQRMARRNQRSLMRIIQGTDETLQDAVAKAAKEAGNIISTLPSEKIGESVRRAMYQQRQASLYNIASELWGDQVSPQVLSGWAQSSQLSVNANREMIDFLTKSVGSGRAGIMAESMRSSARNTFEDLRSRLLNDVDLSESVYNNTAYMQGKIDDVVNNGIGLGKSASEIAKDVTGYINPSVAGGVKYAALRLGRTELNNAFHTTSIRSYMASPYVDQVKWNISGSHPGTDICNDYAEVGPYRPDLVPEKPHPHCFCYLTPITPSEKQFIDQMTGGKYVC